MQPIPASARSRIIQGELQIVVAEEPVESGPRFPLPAPVFGDAVGLQARRYRARGLDGLLVEAGFLSALVIKPL